MIDWRLTPTRSSARAVADLDGDGVVDAIIAPSVWLEVEASQPMEILKGSLVGGKLTLSRPGTSLIEGSVPKVSHGRKLILGDYNGDGKLDAFVCAHGYDAPPYPGTTNALLLSNGAKWTPAVQSWTSFIGFSHGCASGDVRNNGQQDIIVTNNQGYGTYFLRNDGKGNFTQTKVGTPASVATGSSVFTTELIDLDGDGFLDLLLGGSDEGTSQYDYPTTVFWGRGDGSFSDDRSTRLPAVPLAPAVNIFAAADLDGDGKRELIVMRAVGTPAAGNYYKGTHTQVFRFAGRVVTDITASAAAELNSSAMTVITDEQKTPVFCEWAWAADYDGDGRPDLVVSSQTDGAFWARNLGGRFGPWVRIF